MSRFVKVACFMGLRAKCPKIKQTNIRVFLREFCVSLVSFCVTKFITMCNILDIKKPLARAESHQGKFGGKLIEKP